MPITVGVTDVQGGVEQLASAISFLRTFQHLIELPYEYATQELVQDLYMKEPSMLLANINRFLLAFASRRKTPIEEDRWEASLRDVLGKMIRRGSYISESQDWEEPEDIWDPEVTYEQLHTPLKIELLYNLCSYCGERSAVIHDDVEYRLERQRKQNRKRYRIQDEDEYPDLRSQPIGTDSNKNSYWYFDRFCDLPSTVLFCSQGDGPLTLKSVNYDEFKSVCDSLQDDEGMDDFLENVVPTVRKKMKSVLLREEMAIRSLIYNEERPKRRAARKEVQYNFEEPSEEEEEDFIYVEEEEQEESDTSAASTHKISIEPVSPSPEEPTGASTLDSNAIQPKPIAHSHQIPAAQPWVFKSPHSH